MPLFNSKSKKAFSKNVETEMDAGKPKKQSLAIAYSVKRRAKKAEGGPVTSASNQKRPMPNNTYNDSKDVSQNSNKKELYESNWTSRPDIAQSQKGPKTQLIKHPKMVKSDVLQIRLRDDEDDLQDSAGTNEGPQRQPPEVDNELDADKSGTEPHKQTSISTGRKVMAKGGKIEAGDSESHNMFKRTEMEPEENEADLRRTRTDEYDLQDSSSPSEDEGDENAMSRNEENQEQTSGDPDYSEPHSDDLDTAMYADGGAAEGMDQPEPEQEEEHHDSIAAAIMSRRERAKAQIDSGAHDEDLAAAYADGGEVDLELNREEQPNQYYHENEHMEDYGEDLDDKGSPLDSNEMGDSEEDNTSDPHDMVASIRRKMKAKWKLSEV